MTTLGSRGPRAVDMAIDFSCDQSSVHKIWYKDKWTQVGFSTRTDMKELPLLLSLSWIPV
jgi:hypothetical protein